ncbi:MAG: AbiEi antitoxin N-terminal domain-containing protein [Ignavibacteriales bacterium]|nr:AbiEi antitoxin N-terminal domain-containing protein [Ignavibacteriales bacterium]
MNQLINNCTKGTVGLREYLASKGFQKKLLRKYVSGTRLESLDYGAYKLANDEIDWYGAPNTLQKQNRLLYILVVRQH